MFIKSKTREGKSYPYQMLLSFKMLETYILFKTFYWTTVSIVKQLLSDITQFFVRHCLISTANIQACYFNSVLLS